MKSLKPSEIKSLEQFFQLTQPGLLRVMEKYLKSKYETVYATNEYVFAVGDIPIALIAHLDTVFRLTPEDIYYDRVKNVVWSPDGLGADDRAGVYSIVQIIKQGLKPSIILTTDEETGGKGAYALVKTFPAPPTALNYIIELDRRGSVDCVFYDCENPEFTEYIESFGFIRNWGTFSDISIICPNWKVAGVNLSIGYNNEHSYSEILNIGHMNTTIKKVIDMLKCESKPFEYKEAVRANKLDFDWDPSYGVSKSLWNTWHTGEKMLECYDCGLADFEYNLFPVKGIDGELIYLCSDCITNHPCITWCSYCGEPYVSTKESDYCPDCENIIKGGSVK